MTKYSKFLQQKKMLSGEFGFSPVHIHDYLFDFQKYLVEWAVKKGRGALFIDTGLGKTAIQLSIADNIVRKTGGTVLILTPLAVAFQFIDEAKKMGIDSIEYSKDGTFDSSIVITNYERLHYFKPTDFVGMLLDESSILKNFDGATKTKINSFIRKLKYRFLSTATPSPNDYIELGTSSEALGYLGYVDMLTRFFKNNEDTMRPQNIGTKWILKGHARQDFFRWVSTWSISMRRPSDIGFEDDRFILPKLDVEHHPVKNTRLMTIGDQVALIPLHAKRLTEIKQEQRLTIEDRCSKAVEVSSEHDITVYWCNLNDEADLIEKLDSDAVQIKGSMSIDKKEELLLAFSNGEIKKLITKPKITAFGLNWQHCNHTVFFPTFSYEQYYQAIRRFWRFGQKHDVTVDMIFSEGQTRVIESLMAKANKANELFSKLNDTLHSQYTIQSEFDKDIILPKFLQR